MNIQLLNFVTQYMERRLRGQWWRFFWKKDSTCHAFLLPKPKQSCQLLHGVSEENKIRSRGKFGQVCPESILCPKIISEKKYQAQLCSYKKCSYLAKQATTISYTRIIFSDTKFFSLIIWNISTRPVAVSLSAPLMFRQKHNSSIAWREKNSFCHSQCHTRGLGSYLRKNVIISDLFIIAISLETQKEQQCLSSLQGATFFLIKTWLKCSKCKTVTLT